MQFSSFLHVLVVTFRATPAIDGDGAAADIPAHILHVTGLFDCYIS